MAKYLSIVVGLALAVTTPALARRAGEPRDQPAARAVEQCRAIFLSADTNQDGVLSGRELVAAKLAEADDGPLTWAEFLDECLDQDD
jgi:hypothetical protein